MPISALLSRKRNVLKSKPSRKTQINIGIFGLFGAGNLGNDGSLNAMLGAIRSKWPDARIVCICCGDHEVRERFGVHTTLIASRCPPGLRLFNRLGLSLPRRVYDLFRTFRVVWNLDAIIVPGTGILDDFNERWSSMPYDLLVWTLAARILKRPFAFVSIGAGPISHPLSRWLMKSAARLASYRSYRDDVSKAYMCGLGVKSATDIVTPDLAFALPTPSKSASTERSDVGRSIVAIGVMGYYGWRPNQANASDVYRSYIAKLSSFVEWLLEQEFSVRLIIGDQGDVSSVAAIMEKVKRSKKRAYVKRLTTAPASSLMDVMLQMVDTEVVVTTRFHNIVCALMMTKPVISIGYAKKNAALLRKFGLGSFCQHIEKLDLDLLKDQFRTVYAQRSLHEWQIAETAMQHRDALKKQENSLFAKLFAPLKGEANRSSRSGFGAPMPKSPEA